MEAGTLPRFAVREDRSLKTTTPSLALHYENNEVEEWIQSVAGVLDQGWNDQCAPPHNILLRPYTENNTLSQSRNAEADAPLRVPHRVQHLFRARAFPSRRALLRPLARPRREFFLPFASPPLSR